MFRRAPALLAAAALAAAPAVAAPAATPGGWNGPVCGAVSDWLAGFQTAQQTTSAQMAILAASVTTGKAPAPGTLARFRANTADGLDRLARSTDAVVAAMRSAGPAPGRHGRELASRLRQGWTRMAATFRDYARRWRSSPTGSVAAANAAGKRLNAGIQREIDAVFVPPHAPAWFTAYEQSLLRSCPSGRG